MTAWPPATHEDVKDQIDLKLGTTAVTTANSGAAYAVAAPTHGASAYKLTLTANVTLTASGGTTGEESEVHLYLLQDGTGSRTVTWPANVSWGSVGAPVLSTTPGWMDVVKLFTLDGGVTFVGILMTSGINLSGVTTILSDSFTRADTSVSLGSPWIALTGTFGISSNQASTVVLASGEAIALVETSATDHTVSAVLATNVDVGLVARVVDNSNRYRALYSGGTLYLQKTVAGVTSTVTSTVFTVNAGDTLKFAISGTSLTVSVNGVAKISTTDSALTTGTKVGILSDNATGKFDDFLATTP